MTDEEKMQEALRHIEVILDPYIKSLPEYPLAKKQFEDNLRRALAKVRKP